MQVQFIDGIFFVLILIMSIVIHEFAHGYSAYLLGDDTARLSGRLTLNPLKHLDPFGSVILPLLLILMKTGFIIGWARPVPYNPANLRNGKTGNLIVAVSGMNIVILSNILMFALIGLGLWRHQAFYFVLVLICLFIIMVGAPASAIRAGIMSSILLFAQKIGRLSNATRIMIFAAAIMLVFNPLLLRYDVGFQLSFLAVFGLIYIKPILDGRLAKLIKKSELNGILQIITTTLAAQIAVLGILIYNFGRISFISPIVNVSIVPLLPFVTAIILVFSGATFIWSFLGKILIWPTYFATTYILRLIEWFSKIPFAAKEISNVHWIWLVGYYVLLIGFLFWYKKKKQNVYKDL